ncbi:hypothetical protein [Stratiformator vulcanicus]|uniref:Transposase IS200 like protein n=1 Tax=Stratiformator vulcanicus TaxID=2527980 RepID=A0A517R6R2_9PLAN|nr:hypothetical protein [Stratiformator vulcanicus]QDT39570.1 hypothetical protein Pan189_39790 [Stratiformator vulcanicus]
MTGKWWLVTWSTYGTWLPGDPRGFQTWRKREYVPPPERYAKHNEKTYEARRYEDLHYSAEQMMAAEPVYLEENEQQIVVAAVYDESSSMELQPSVIAVMSDHTHLLAKFGSLEIRKAVGRLKAAATRQLHSLGMTSGRAWSRCCHMKSKPTEREYLNAVAYVKKHEEQGATVFDWKSPFE